MADRDHKVPDNVPGKYYVDEDCILCNLCEETAPENFKDGEEFAFVKKQPENDEEEELCRHAVEECPTECIGDDGV